MASTDDIGSRIGGAWKAFSDKFSNFFEPNESKAPDWPDDLPPTPYALARGPIILGLSVLILFAVIFGAWASLANLAAAAVASGQVTVDTNRKEVQHLEGGIVAELLAIEGDRVKEGQVLIRLDDTRTSASVELILGQYRAVLALIASLNAEMVGKDMPDFPEELSANMDEREVKDIVDSQTRLFLARKQALQGQIDVLRQQVKQFDEEIAGLQAQKEAETQQLRLIKEEIVGVRELFNKGLERKPRLLALEREGQEIEGRIGQYQAEIARANQSMLENELNIQDLINQTMTDVAEQLRQAETQRADLAERLRAVSNQQDRADIIAPRDGIVVNMKANTIGGVIQPGQTVLEIVPDDALIIEARVAPRDIDVVHTGLSAQVILTAFNTRKTPYLDATVTNVSADVLRDDTTGEPFYEARVLVDLSKLDDFPEISLYPGMPVEVMIVTGKRTPLQYITAPFKSALRKAGRET